MSTVLPDSQETLDIFRTRQQQQHASPDAFLLARALNELSDQINGVAAIPAAPGPLPTAPALVAVDPAVGAVGLIALPTFTDGDAPLATPTTAPPYHGARSMTLAAPEENAGIIYWSQFDTVRPVGGTAAITPVQYLDEPIFDAQGDWLYADQTWTFIGNTAALQLTNPADGESSLYQTITLPAGNYEIDIDIGLSDEAVIDIAVNGTVVQAAVPLGATTIPLTWAGGSFEIRAIATWVNAVNLDVSINVISVTSVPPSISAANIGTPLKPGEVIILTGRDIDLTRPLYVVPIIGETGEKVISNYLY